MGLLEKNLIFVKFEKVTRRASLLERRVYFFVHLNKGGFIREGGNIRENTVYPQIPYDKLGINTYSGKMEYIWFQTNIEGNNIDCQNNIFLLMCGFKKSHFWQLLKFMPGTWSLELYCCNFFLLGKGVSSMILNLLPLP